MLLFRAMPFTLRFPDKYRLPGPASPVCSSFIYPPRRLSRNPRSLKRASARGKRTVLHAGPGGYNPQKRGLHLTLRHPLYYSCIEKEEALGSTLLYEQPVCRTRFGDGAHVALLCARVTAVPRDDNSATCAPSQKRVCADLAED